MTPVGFIAVGVACGLALAAGALAVALAALPWSWWLPW